MAGRRDAGDVRLRYLACEVRMDWKVMWLVADVVSLVASVVGQALLVWDAEDEAAAGLDADAEIKPLC